MPPKKPKRSEGELSDVLEKQFDMLAKSYVDLGKTDLVRHRIETGSAQPVKEASRRPPQAFAAEKKERRLAFEC